MKKNILMLIISAVIVSACGGGTKESSNNGSNNSNFMLSLRPSSENTASEYLVPKGELISGEVSSQGVGDEQQGWNFYYKVGGTLFVSGYLNNEVTAYKLDDKKALKKISSFLFDKLSPLEMFSHTGSTLLATNLPRDGAHTARKMYVISADDGKLKQTINYTVFDKDTGERGKGLVAAPTAIQVRGDKLFVAFHKLDDSSPSTKFTTPEPNSALIAVYNYPLTDNAKPLKIIEDARTSNIGVNGNLSNMVQLDNGDIYSFSNGSIAAGFYPASTKPSGILRIKNGQTEFDANYFFDVENATNGGKVFWIGKIGGNKLLARILTNDAEAQKKPWSAFNKDFYILKLVMIDLDKKEVTPVEGVPVHRKRHTSPIQVINGKVYLSIEAKESRHIYEYDVATNKAKKGAKIMGHSVKGVYKLSN